MEFAHIIIAIVNTPVRLLNLDWVVGFNIAASIGGVGLLDWIGEFHILMPIVEDI